MSLGQPLIQWTRRTLTWSTSVESRHERRIGWALFLSAAVLVLLALLRGVVVWSRAADEPFPLIPRPFDLLLFAGGCIGLLIALASWLAGGARAVYVLPLVALFGAVVLVIPCVSKLLWVTRSDDSIHLTLPIASDRFLIAAGLVWFISLLVLIRLGFVKLLGPVLFYDMVRSSRRARYFLLRGFYSLVLLVMLFFVWMNTPSQNVPAQELASRMAMDYFELFTVAQLVAVVLLTPAYVAGAISEEKDRKTLEFLLATDLRNREIVLSKFLARLAHLVLFLLTGLPILGLLQFLGGIDPNLVFAGFTFTMITTIGIGGVSILNSVTYKRPRDSIAISYFMVIAYLFITSMLFQYHEPLVFRTAPAAYPPPANTEEALFDILYIGNIIVVLTKVYCSGSRGSLSADLPGLMQEYTLFYGGIALVCVVWSIVRLRRRALKQTFARTKLSQQAKDRPVVGDLPMLWKEIHVEGSLRLNWVAWILVALLVLGTFVNPFIWLVEWTLVGVSADRRDFVRDINLWARFAGMAVACVTILGVAIRAANSIGNERERQTLDDLLCTPLTSTSILAAKFFGALCSVRLGWVWLGAIYIIALCTGGLHIFAFPLVLASWFIFASMAALIGLNYSMSSHTTLRATVYTVLTCVGLGLGHWLIWFCCMPIMLLAGSGGDGGQYIMKFEAGVTPPLVILTLGFCGDDFAPQGQHNWIAEFFKETAPFAVFGLFLWALAALFFWNGVLVPRFRMLTGRDAEAQTKRPTPPPLPTATTEENAAT